MTANRRRKLREDVWLSHKPLLRYLYLVQNRSVREIREHMLKYYDIDLSSRQMTYHMFDIWGWKKYDKSKGNTQVTPRSSSSRDQSDGACGACMAHYRGEQPEQAERLLFHGDLFKKERADTGLALNHHNYAFENMVDLSYDAMDRDGFDTAGCDSLLLGCFLTARTARQKQQAVGLAEIFESRGPGLSEQIDILKTSAIQTCNASGLYDIDGPFRVPDKKVSAKDKVAAINWDNQQPLCTVCDFSTWRAIVAATLDEYRKAKEEALCYDSFFQSQPINKGVVEASCKECSSRPTSLSECCSWAIHQLLRDTQDLTGTRLEVPAFVLRLRKDGKSTQRVNHCILLTSLLDVARSNPPPWWHRTELELGTPPVLVLSTVCHSILELPYEIGSFEASQVQADSLFSLLDELKSFKGSSRIFLDHRPTSALASAVTKFAKLSPNEVGRSFLEKLIGHDRASSPDQETLMLLKGYLDGLRPIGLLAPHVGDVSEGDDLMPADAAPAPAGPPMVSESTFGHIGMEFVSGRQGSHVPGLPENSNFHPL